MMVVLVVSGQGWGGFGFSKLTLAVPLDFRGRLVVRKDRNQLT